MTILSLLCKDHVPLHNEQVIWERHFEMLVDCHREFLPFLFVYAVPPIKRIHPLNLDWPCNLVWPVQCGGSGISLLMGLKRSWSFQLKCSSYNVTLISLSALLGLSHQSKETQAVLLNDETGLHEGEKPSQPSWRHQTCEWSHLGFFNPDQAALVNTTGSRGNSSPGSSAYIAKSWEIINGVLSHYDFKWFSIQETDSM